MSTIRSLSSHNSSSRTPLTFSVDCKMSMLDTNHDRGLSNRATSLIQIPPENVKKMIDSTVSYIIKNGPETESLLLDRDQSGHVAFLRSDNPYNPYYKARLMYGEDIPVELLSTSSSFVPPPPPPPSTDTSMSDIQPQAPSTTQSTIPSSTGQITGATTVIAKPIPITTTSTGTSLFDQLTNHIESITLAIPPEDKLLQLKKTEDTLTTKFSVKETTAFEPFELELCNLTALFSARNGLHFLRRLYKTEVAENNQLGFTKQFHPLTTRFRILSDAYNAILAPKPELLNNLRRIANRPQDEYHRLRALVMQKHAENLRLKKEALEEQEELIQRQLIDWLDFDIVATIYFSPEEDLQLAEPDMDIESIERMMAFRQASSLEALAYQEESSTQTMDGEDREINYDEEMTKEPNMYNESYENYDFIQDDGSNTETMKSAQVIIDTMEDEEDLVISSKQAFELHSMETSKTQHRQTQICPNCKQSIPTDELDEHMRIELLDPHWQSQRQMEELRRKETNMAHGADISLQIAKFTAGDSNASVSGANIANRPKTFHELLAEQNASASNQAAEVHQQEKKTHFNSSSTYGGMKLNRNTYGMGQDKDKDRDKRQKTSHP